jgi:type II secretory pathway pseudopilin PulG
MINKTQAQHGFGLIGLLITILIIGLLAAGSLKAYYGRRSVIDDTGKEVEYGNAIDAAAQAKIMLEHPQQ